MMALQLSRESYISFPSSTLIDFKELQPENELGPIYVTLLGITIELRLEQSTKAFKPILSTLWGIFVVLHPAIKRLLAFIITALQLSRESNLVFPSSTIIEVKELQPLSALSSMDVTLLGITIEVKPQFLKTSYPISLTPSGIVKDDKFTHPSKAILPIVFTLLGIVIEDRLTHPRKACGRISVTPSGISSVVILTHPSKTLLFISVMLLGIVIEDKLTQPEKTSEPMDVTLLGMEMEARLEQPANAR